MSDHLWQWAPEASQRFAAQALDYDRYRPRYPESLFDDIINIAGLSARAPAIEVGAGTGIATEALVLRGLALTGIEPAAEMAAVAEAKVADRAQIVVGHFEDFTMVEPVRLVASFNAWHWVDPRVAIDRVGELLEPNGYLALVWTEVVSWGQDPFEERLAEVCGYLWPKGLDDIEGSVQSICRDTRFDGFRLRHHRFERRLDAASFVAVTKTYGGHRTDEQYVAIAQTIDDLGGSVNKIEDASLYMWRRR